MLKRRDFAAVTAIGALFAGQALAQTSRLTTVFVPFPVGGALDNVARLLTQRITEQAGESFAIDNRVGANGMIGSKAAAKAKADGKTILIADGAGFTINPFLYPVDPTFSSERDLRPLRTLVTQPMVLVVRPSHPSSTVGDFIALAKKDLVTYSTAGVGTSGHLTMSFLSSVTGGLKLSHIPYRGGPQATQAVLAGEVHALFDTLPNVLPFIKRGDLKVLAISSGERSPLLPQVPTMVELGFPGFVVENRFFVWVPVDTPDDAAKKVDAMFEAAIKDPTVNERLRAMAFLPLPTTAEAESRKWLVANKNIWQKVIKDHNIQPE